MTDIAIRVENLSKEYRIGAQQSTYPTLRDSLVAAARAPFRRLSSIVHRPLSPQADDTIWALKDVSFEVKRGEVLGIIGRNGAGKSTLLKILSRITLPTEGTVDLYGRVGSLLEVGTGFHPELTGRENVYLNGAILGMKRAEIERKFDEIVAFSEIEKFLDTPVKHYSSGMHVRLAFAVAAHLDPEILLVDEVLAVGDAAFQKKCLGKMGQVAGAGRTVLFVSHNMGFVAELCERALLLQEGEVLAGGDTRDVIEQYMPSDQSDGFVDLRNWSLDRSGQGPMSVSYLATVDSGGQVRSRFSYGEEIVFLIGVEANSATVCTIGISIRDSLGRLILHVTNADDRVELMLRSKRSTIRVRLHRLILNDGRYSITVWLGDSLSILHDRVGDSLSFSVDSSLAGAIRSLAPVRVPAEWMVLSEG